MCTNLLFLVFLFSSAKILCCFCRVRHVFLNYLSVLTYLCRCVFSVSFTRQRSCGVRTSFVALFGIVGVTLVCYHQFEHVGFAKSDLRRAVDGVFNADSVDDQMFKGSTKSQISHSKLSSTVPRLGTRTFTSTTTVVGQQNDAPDAAIETSPIAPASQPSSIIDTTTVVGSTAAVTCALLQASTDGEVCPKKGEQCQDSSHGPICVCDGDCLGITVVDDDDSSLVEKNTTDTRSLSQIAHAGAMPRTQPVPTTAPKPATTVVKWTAPVVSKRSTVSAQEQQHEDEQPGVKAIDAYADHAPTCENRMESCVDAWRPCCPGGKALVVYTIWVMGFAKRNIVQRESTAKCPYFQSPSPILHVFVVHLYPTEISTVYSYGTK